jgi:hypothetical protein
MQWWWLVAALLLALVPLLLLFWRVGRAQTAEGQLERARRQFQLQREHLEAQFLPAAAATGKPRGLRWLACEWENGVVFARERQTGLLIALVGVTVRFEAVEGSDMEGLPAVGNLRNASAVFYYRQGRWQTGGKVVFNLNPDEAVAHFKNRYEPVG